MTQLDKSKQMKKAIAIIILTKKHLLPMHATFVVKTLCKVLVNANQG